VTSVLAVVTASAARCVDRDSSVGIATRYGPGIESRSGRDGPHPPRPALGPTQPSIQRVSSPSSAVVKERLDLDFCSPSGLSWPVQGRPLPLPFYTRCLGLTFVNSPLRHVCLSTNNKYLFI